MENLYNSFKGCFIGGIIGDIYGCPYEFHQKDDIEENFPEYKSGEYQHCYVHGIPKGYYTDDTSMALCLAANINHYGVLNNRVLDLYSEWYTNGLFSSNGKCFDIGIGTQKVLTNYIRTGDTGDTSSFGGNGALMRCAPVIVRYFGDEQLYNQMKNQTEMTHGAFEAILASKLMVDIINVISLTLHDSITMQMNIESILAAEFGKHYIPSENGFCLGSLYIATYSFLKTDNFLDCIIKAVSFGGDTDTNACIAGIIAGFAYGYDAIPENLRTFKDDEKIHEMFEKLYSLR